jgi:hypothetical protein
MLRLGSAETLDFIGLLRCYAWEGHFPGCRGGKVHVTESPHPSINNPRNDSQTIRANLLFSKLLYRPTKSLSR